MQFLANENFPLKSVLYLRKNNIDVAAISEDSPGASDQAILARASREKRIILTFDRDYGELIYRLRRSPPAGVIYLRFIPKTPEEPARYLLQLLEKSEIALDGKFTVADYSQVRQRLQIGRAHV